MGRVVNPGLQRKDLPFSTGRAPGHDTDASSLLQSMADMAESDGRSLTLGENDVFYVNGPVTFRCSVFGGTFRLGASANVLMVAEAVDTELEIFSRFENVSGNDLLQALRCEGSVTTERRGHIRCGSRFYGFLKGVYGRYLKIFEIDRTAYAESENTVAGRFAEAHFACNQTMEYRASGLSVGGVLGYSSGAQTIREQYTNVTVRGSFDHGIYASSPDSKELSEFRNVTVEDAGGDGIKVLSNGAVMVNDPHILRCGKTGIIAIGKNVTITGGSIEDSHESAIYHTGKDFGAGANQFESFSVIGTRILGGEDDGIRIHGPAEGPNGPLEIARVKIACEIRVAKRPVVISGDSLVASVSIENADLHTTSAVEAAVSVIVPVGEITVSNSDVRADATTANLIDVNAPILTLRNVAFTATSVQRASRNRSTTGVTRERNCDLTNLTFTGAQPFLQDGTGGVNSIRTLVSSSGQQSKDFLVDALPASGVRGEKYWLRTPTLGSYAGWACTATGTPGTIRPFAYIPIDASAVVNPPELAATGAEHVGTISVGGAAVGDYVQVSFSQPLGLVSLRAEVSSTNTVEYRFRLLGAAPVDLASGTVRVRVTKSV